jgi:hemerythrin superfamily protein
MPTASQTQGSKSTRRSAAAKKAAATRAKDAIAQLKADHRAVEKLFKDFENASGETRKMQIASRICLELKVHTQLEEELVYPVSREFLSDDDIVDEAVVEHQAAKDLISQIEGMGASDEMFEAKVKVLQEQIEHHLEEEETEYFPKIQKTEMDTMAIGEQMIARKAELKAQMKGDGMEMH